VNVLLFKLDDYDRCLQGTGGVVPEFVNPKWANKDERTSFKSPTRLECMMQDFPRLCSSTDKVGFTQLDRWIAKTSVKNNLVEAAKLKPPKTECALSAEADFYDCNARLLQLAAPGAEIEPNEDVSFLGIAAQLGARIILKPSFAVSLEQMKAKLRGKIRISKKSTLILDGNVEIDGLKLDGALTVSGSGTATGLCVENQGCTIESIPSAELSSQPPSFQIRGYMLKPGDMEHVRLQDSSGRENMFTSVTIPFVANAPDYTSKRIGTNAIGYSALASCGYSTHSSGYSNGYSRGYSSPTSVSIPFKANTSSYRTPRTTVAPPGYTGYSANARGYSSGFSRGFSSPKSVSIPFKANTPSYSAPRTIPVASSYATSASTRAAPMMSSAPVALGGSGAAAGFYQKYSLERDMRLRASIDNTVSLHA